MGSGRGQSPPVFADLVLKDGGAQELLPASNTVIFDEAHQLPETATMFWRVGVERAISRFGARQPGFAGIAHAPDFPAIGENGERIGKARAICGWCSSIQRALGGRSYSRSRWIRGSAPEACQEALREYANRSNRKSTVTPKLRSASRAPTNGASRDAMEQLRVRCRLPARRR